jgi:hypothetical protein
VIGCGERGQPAAHGRPALSPPVARMRITQPVAVLGEPAARRPAGRQRPVPPGSRIRTRGPALTLRPPRLIPPLAMRQAPAAPTTGTAAAGHPTSRSPQDRVPRRGDDHLSGELRADRSRKPFGETSPARAGRRRGRHGAGVHPASCSVSQPAATSARRASSIFK